MGRKTGSTELKNGHHTKFEDLTLIADEKQI